MKDIKIDIFKYCNVVIPMSKNEVINLGYIDGYFNEKAYLEYIADKDMLMYSKGYIMGEDARIKDDITNVETRKNIWIHKLAKNDAIYNISPRDISKEYYNEYILNYNDVKSGLESEVSPDYFEKLLEQGLAIEDKNSSWGYRLLDEKSKSKK